MPPMTTGPTLSPIWKLRPQVVKSCEALLDFDPWLAVVRAMRSTRQRTSLVQENTVATLRQELP